MHTQKRQLNQPKQEEANHRIRLNALRLGNAIVQRQKGGPNSHDHGFDGIRAIHVLDCEPEDGEDRARYDGDV